MVTRGARSAVPIWRPSIENSTAAPPPSGEWLVVLTASMALTAERRSSSRCKNARRSAEVGYLPPGSGSCITVTCEVSTPRLNSYCSSALRTSSPVPDSRTTASATCAMVIRATPCRWRPAPPPALLPSLMVTLTSALTVCHAGATPKAMPTARQMAAMTANTDGSMAYVT